MVISHEHQFIFWKPHKVGSTSVMAALGAHCGPHDTVGGALDREGHAKLSKRRNMSAFVHLPTAGNHAKPAQIKDVTNALWGPSIWSAYLKITIIRNPWDRTLSWWDYVNNSLERPMSLVAASINSERDYWFHGAIQWPDVFLRYERLAEDYKSLCDRLQLPYRSLPHLRPGTRDRRKPYWAYFDEGSRAEVARNYSMEIDRFGYAFEEEN